MKFNPKVSIIIPVYNGENYLKEAIESALSQTYNNIEIIVVNDGSKDRTEEVAKSFGNKIKYYRKENGGVSTALNFAIGKMTGEYFSWLSHDDLYFPDKVEKQIKFLNKMNDRNVILYANFLLVDEYGKLITGPMIINHKLMETKPEYALLRGNLNGITMLIPKKAFTDCGVFDEKLRCAQDYEMWQRLMKKYKFIHMKAIVAKTRVHSKQVTSTNPKVIEEGNIFWINAIDSIPNKRKIELEGSIYNYYYRMGSHLVCTEFKETVKHCIKICNKIDSKKYNKRPLLDSNDEALFKKENILQKMIFLIDTRGFSGLFDIIMKNIRGKTWRK